MARRLNVVVVGAGPAGIAAGIFLQRTGLGPLVIEQGEPGGLLRSANLVENYPGFPRGIKGRDLARLFCRQLKSLALPVTNGCVTRIESKGGFFTTRTDKHTYTSNAVIVATGTRPCEPRLKAADTLIGRSVFNEIVDIPPRLLKGKRAVVIGGGDAAFDYALNLASTEEDVIILSRSTPRCLGLLQERARDRGVRVYEGCEAKSVRADQDGVVLHCVANVSSRELRADLVLMACGRTQNVEILSVALREAIGKRPAPETAIPGLFVAGDVARGAHRQTGIAVGDGIRAAMMVQDFLRTGRECG